MIVTVGEVIAGVARLTRRTAPCPDGRAAPHSAAVTREKVGLDPVCEAWKPLSPDTTWTKPDNAFGQVSGGMGPVWRMRVEQRPR